MRACARCGNPLGVEDAFCGACGLAAPPLPAPHADPSSASTAVPPSRLPRVIAGALFVSAAAVAVATLTLTGVLFTPSKAPASANPDHDAAQEGERSRSDDDDPTKQPTPRSRPRLQLADATEVERPGDHPYASSRSSCTRTQRLTDQFKELGLEIDESIRKGSTLSDEEEARIGKDAMAEFERELGGRITSSGSIPRYLAEVAAPMVSKVKRAGPEYRFYLWEGTDIENAFALPGGHVMVSKPMFDRWILNEAQLATILGHEIGHVDLRHPLGVFESLRALGIPEEDQMAQLLVHLARTPYSSPQEEDADVYGGRALHAIGYSIFQSVDLWNARVDDQPAGSGSSGGALVDVFLGELENIVQTHPDSAARACRLEQLAYELYREEPLDVAYVGKTNKRTRVPATQQTY